MTRAGASKETVWHPTKFVLADGRLVPAPSMPGSSHLVAALVAEFYGRAVPLHARGALVDLGCGASPFFELYRPYADSVMWLDWPHSQHTNPALDAACDLNVGVPVRDGVFQTVIVSDVLEHLRRPWVTWSEMLRMLTPGGVILGNAPFLYWVHEAPYDFHRYTEHALRAAVEDAGGELVTLDAIGGSVDVLVDIIGKHIARAPVVGPRLARLIARAALWFGRTCAGMRLRGATSATFPLGYVWIVRKPSAQ